MNYKTISDNVLNNSIDFFSCKDDYDIIDEKNAEEVIENLKNTIFNFETTQTPVDDLKTIQRCLNAKVKVDLDEYLPKCKIISIVIFHLSDESFETVNEILLTLCCFTQRYESKYTLLELRNQITIFSDLLDHKDIVKLLPHFSSLLYQVIKYDNGEAASRLVNETTFIEKISEILKPPNDNQIILTNFINCIYYVLKKLSKEEFHECSTKFEEQEQNYKKKSLLRLPFANVCEYILSEDSSTLISILKLYQIILINREGDIDNYLTEEIFNRIGFLLDKSHELDPDGFILKHILKIIDVFIFVYIGNMEKYGDQVKLVIESLINQIERISKLPSLHVDGVKFDKSLQYLPYIIDILSRISKYAAEIFSEKNFINNLFRIYENMNYRMKCDLSYIFLNVFNQFSEEIINDCDQKDDGDDKYDFIGVVMNDSIESLQNNEEMKKVVLVFEVLFKLFSVNLELKNLFDDETITQLLDDYREYNEVYDFWERVKNLYEQPLDEVDESDIVL